MAGYRDISVKRAIGHSAKTTDSNGNTTIQVSFWMHWSCLLADSHFDFLISLCQYPKIRYCDGFLEYVKKLDRYIDRFEQKMTDMLHMDELFLKERGGFDYLWASICRDTRFSVMILALRRNRTIRNAAGDILPLLKDVGFLCICLLGICRVCSQFVDATFRFLLNRRGHISLSVTSGVSLPSSFKYVY